jgi:hypothetical protein
MVHVGNPGSAISAPEINKVAKECASAEMKSVDILGWAFEPGIAHLAHRIGSQHSVRIGLVQIPREALEVQPRDATRKPEIRFSALSRLEVEARWNHKNLTLTLKGFIPSDPEVLPQGLRGKVKHFSDFIDYWAVDFDYQAGGAFRPMWQSFRTRRSHRPETTCCHTYEEEGTLCVLIQVVDIFGNETTEWLDLNPSDSISQKGERKCRSRKEKVKGLEICKRRS